MLHQKKYKKKYLNVLKSEIQIKDKHVWDRDNWYQVYNYFHIAFRIWIIIINNRDIRFVCVFNIISWSSWKLSTRFFLNFIANRGSLLWWKTKVYSRIICDFGNIMLLLLSFNCSQCYNSFKLVVASPKVYIVGSKPQISQTKTVYYWNSHMSCL